MAPDAFAYDISGPAPMPPAEVARPASVEELTRIVGEATGDGMAVVARGAGMSYTGGYWPVRERTLMIDMTGLDRVVEVAAGDRFVTVEAGCSWRQLDEALAGTHMRPPFFGPLSGFLATVGGALSNNGSFFGHGTAAEAALALDVVLADGSMLSTGSAIAKGRRPFMRQFGPDLTGIFLGDCGAFGVKARATLRLEPSGVAGFASFSFETGEALLAAQVGLAGMRGLAECFGFDPEAHENLRRAGFSLGDSAGMLADTARAGGVFGALKMAARGTGFLDDLKWSLHFTAEGEDVLKAAKRQVTEAGGREIPDTIPRVTRAKPFRRIKALLGPGGERWLPVHGVFPLSVAARALAEVRALVAEHATPAVRVSYLTALAGSGMIIEPQFFWSDALSPLLRQSVTEDQLQRYGDVPENPETRALVVSLRERMGALFDRLGAIHFQIGRHYPFLDQATPAARAALVGLKNLFDPKGLMNPGVLQF